MATATTKSNLRRFREFYIGKKVKRNGQIGTVEAVEMMAKVMLGVRFVTGRFAVLAQNEIELALPSECE